MAPLLIALALASLAGAAAAGSNEALFWSSIKDSGDAGELEAYLAQYPNGAFAALAKARIDRLKAKQQQQAAVAPPPAPGEAVQELDATYVALRTAKVRAAPAGTAKELGNLAADTPIAVTGKVKDKDWLRVAWKDGAGYVSAPLLKEVDGAEPAAWGKVKGSRKADEVEAFIKAYPQGHFAERAAALVTALRAPTPAPAPPAATPAVGTYTAPAGRLPGSTFRDCAECPEMVKIPAGSFTMGTPAGEQDRTDLEGPQHQVTVRQFGLGKYEVTFAEWDACSNAGGCAHRPSDNGWGRDRRPVVNVSWDDAKAYAAWLSRRTGKSYRLASEAEWEYAARAGTSTARHWGDAIGSGNANCDGCGSQWDGKQTAPVGSFRANGFGLHDMLGNVWEWTEDCWNGSYAGAPSDGSASTSGNCGGRVLRGGSWVNVPWGVRAGYRDRNDTALRNRFGGFRVARTE